MRADRLALGWLGFLAGGMGSCGTTSARILALGASTPWSRIGGPLTSRSEVMRTPKQIRCSRGHGTSAERADWGGDRLGAAGQRITSLLVNKLR